MLLIEVDVLEASMLVEVVCDGKVIIWNTDDSVCQEYPNLCCLAAGDKLTPKRELGSEKGRKWERIKDLKERKEGKKWKKKLIKRKKERIKRHFSHSIFQTFIIKADQIFCSAD